VNARRLLFLAFAAVLGASLWWRKHPSACPYGQRFWVEAPHPLITRERLRQTLRPQAGERVLEIGPGTGYYSLDLARWLEPGGTLELFDIQREFLDHAMERVAAAGITNVSATQGDAASLPHPDASVDAVVLTCVLGEIPDQDAALSEVARVLRPGGRLVVGELFGDPHYTSPAALERRGQAAGLRLEERSGPAIGYFARLLAS
jgi:protein-L-isoaspartate O-methyltransferase